MSFFPLLAIIFNVSIFLFQFFLLALILTLVLVVIFPTILTRPLSVSKNTLFSHFIYALLQFFIIRFIYHVCSLLLRIIDALWDEHDDEQDAPEPLPPLPRGGKARDDLKLRRVRGLPSAPLSVSQLVINRDDCGARRSIRALMRNALNPNE